MSVKKIKVISDEEINRALDTFSDLGLSQWLCDTCALLGMHTPTPIQKKWKDVIGCAKTGSGKTAAYVLPILNKLSEEPTGLFCITVAPTRELAVQIYDQYTSFGKPINAKISLIVGGVGTSCTMVMMMTDMMKQSADLQRKPHIIVCTLGRLLDHIKSGCKLNLARVKYLVLDEADRLLSGTFLNEIEPLLSLMPSGKGRQTLLFSATMSESLLEMEKSFDNIVSCVVDSPKMTVDSLKQTFSLVPSHVKDVYLFYVLKREPMPSSVIVFVSTCEACERIHRMCKLLEIESVSLHSVKERLDSLNMFKSHRKRVLVATDVASRGLDIPEVELVLNYDVPRASEDYIHRVGRTARAGKTGEAISLVSEVETKKWKRVEDHLGSSVPEQSLPEDEVLVSLSKVTKTARQARLEMLEAGFGESKKRREKVRAIRDKRKRHAPDADDA